MDHATPDGKVKKKRRRKVSAFKAGFWKSHWKEALIVFTLAAGLYVPTVNYEFVLDDAMVITKNNFTKTRHDSTRQHKEEEEKEEQTKNAFAVGAMVTSELIAEQRLTQTEDPRNLHQRKRCWRSCEEEEQETSQKRAIGDH